MTEYSLAKIREYHEDIPKFPNSQNHVGGEKYLKDNKHN